VPERYLALASSRRAAGRMASTERPTIYRSRVGAGRRELDPLLRLLALVACGTRSLIAVAVGPTSSGETTMCQRLTASLHAGMLVLCVWPNG
jgi:hypothetical protein